MMRQILTGTAVVCALTFASGTVVLAQPKVVNPCSAKNPCAAKTADAKKDDAKK